jgi:hypothetical protein
MQGVRAGHSHVAELSGAISSSADMGILASALNMEPCDLLAGRPHSMPRRR